MLYYYSMILRKIKKENKKNFQEFVPPELSFLLGMEDHVVVGLMEEEGKDVIPAGVLILSFGEPDAITIEWLYISEEYRGHSYSDLFFDSVHDLAIANQKERVIAKLWGRYIGEADGFLSDLGFVPVFPFVTDTVYFLSDLGDIDDLAMEGNQARKVGFELFELPNNFYIPKIFGTPESALLKRAMASALYAAASKENSANAAVYLRCAPWENVAMIKDFFAGDANTITAACYEAPVHQAENLPEVLEEERAASDRMRAERDAIPAELVMVGIEEY